MDDTKYKILLVEDNELDQAAFKRFVEESSLPYDCIIAASVREARIVLAEGRFDVIVADYLLGDGTAFDILDSVKETPTIFITGAGDQDVAVKAWKAGAYDYLIKGCREQLSQDRPNYHRERHPSQQNRRASPAQ